MNNDNDMEQLLEEYGREKNPQKKNNIRMAIMKLMGMQSGQPQQPKGGGQQQQPPKGGGGGGQQKPPEEKPRIPSTPQPRPQQQYPKMDFAPQQQMPRQLSHWDVVQMARQAGWRFDGNKWVPPTPPTTPQAPTLQPPTQSSPSQAQQEAWQPFQPEMRMPGASDWGDMDRKLMAETQGGESETFRDLDPSLSFEPQGGESGGWRDLDPSLSWEPTPADAPSSGWESAPSVDYSYYDDPSYYSGGGLGEIDYGYYDDPSYYGGTTDYSSWDDDLY